MSAQITALTAEISELHNVLQLAMKFLPSRAMPHCFKTRSKVKRTEVPNHLLDIFMLTVLTLLTMVFVQVIELL